MNIEEFKDDRLDRVMYKTNLSSGIEAYFVPLNNEANVSMFHLFTRFGSIDAKFYDSNLNQEVKVQDGTAHFLEHCGFYDPDGNDAMGELNSMGVYSNAWTSFDHTTYYFHNAGEHTERDLAFLINFLTTPYLTDKVVAKEQGVISQEIARAGDDPRRLLFRNLMEGLVKDHPLKRSILGSKDTIMQITKEYLQSAYDTFYHPSNLTMVMFVPSNDALNDAKQNFALAERLCNEKGFDIREPPKYIYVPEPLGVAQKRVIAAHEVPEPQACIGFKGNFSMERTASERFRASMVNDILASTLLSEASEAMFNLRKSGAIKGRLGGYDYTGRGFELFVFQASTGNLDNFHDGVTGMLKEQVNGGMSKDLFEIVKKGKVAQAAKLLELEEPKGLASHFIHSLAAEFNPMEEMKLLLDISYDEVLETGKKYLDTDNYTMSVINPRG